MREGKWWPMFTDIKWYHICLCISRNKFSHKCFSSKQKRLLSLFLRSSCFLGESRSSCPAGFQESSSNKHHCPSLSVCPGRGRAYPRAEEINTRASWVSADPLETPCRMKGRADQYCQKQLSIKTNRARYSMISLRVHLCTHFARIREFCH